jgi:hypothetical protein
MNRAGSPERVRMAASVNHGEPRGVALSCVRAGMEIILGIVLAVVWT